MRAKHLQTPALLLCGLLASAGSLPVQAQATNPVATHTPSAFRAPRLSVAWQLGMSGTVGPLVEDSMLVIRQIGAVAVGLTAEYGLTERLGLEAAFAWSPSTVAISDWMHTIDRPATVWLGSIRMRVLAAASPHYALTIASGVGLLDRRGAAWQELAGMRRAAAVLGANLWFRTRGPLSYGLELQDYLSHARYRDSLGTVFTARVHNDVVITFSLRYAAIPL